MRPGRPKTLAGQLALLVALALLLAQAVNAALLFKERSERTLEEISAPAIARLVDTAERFSDARQSVVRGRMGRAWITDAGVTGDSMKPLPRVSRHITRELSDDDVRFADIRVFLTDSATLQTLIPRFVRGRIPDDRPLVLVSAQLTAGPWINTSLPAPPSGGGILGQILLQTAVIYVVLLLAVFWIGRHAAKTLNRLTHAVADIGTEPGLEFSETALEISGPADMRQLAEAFNEMRRRIAGMLMEKDRMLGAIGHDLRTPLASLRLRAESIPDENERLDMISTIEELDGTLDDILMLARFRQSAEAPVKVDVGELVDAVAEDFRELGGEVEVAPFSRMIAALRPALTRRALRNLIDNALKYGGRARIFVMQDGRLVRIVIEDDGPGIDPELFDRVFADFERIEDSRNRATGGTGLGLSLAREIIHREGGDISLENRDSGGLRVNICFPQVL